jgi:DNA-binding NtrC family response regulator
LTRASGVVLVVDDQEPVREALELLLEVHGLPVASVGSAEEATARVRKRDVLAVVQDMNFTGGTTSGEEGIALFRALRAIDERLPILLMTAWTSLETAVALVRDGAADYVEKPWNDDKLVAALRRLTRIRELEVETDRLRRISALDRDTLARAHDLRGLVYASAAVHRVVELALRVAPSDAPILVLGPNGSGKEKLAEIIAYNSRRKGRPFVRVNAGAIPEALLESELFGAEAGAFTGATRPRVGHFEAADGGTLFLDEIGNLSLSGQQKLLRVLQTGELQRLGSSQVRKVDVRVISATNEDLRKAIAQKTFREDLYFRLNVVELSLPRLADRAEDILPLARAFLARAGTDLCLSSEAEQALLRHDFAGNVRELENIIRRATLVRDRERPIEPEDLGLEHRPLDSSDRRRETTLGAEAIEAAMREHDGNVSRAAAHLGVSRQALYRRMDKLQIAARSPRTTSAPEADRLARSVG